MKKIYYGYVGHYENNEKKIMATMKLIWKIY